MHLCLVCWSMLPSGASDFSSVSCDPGNSGELSGWWQEGWEPGQGAGGLRLVQAAAAATSNREQPLAGRRWWCPGWDWRKTALDFLWSVLCIGAKISFLISATTFLAYYAATWLVSLLPVGLPGLCACCTSTWNTQRESSRDLLPHFFQVYIWDHCI